MAKRFGSYFNQKAIQEMYAASMHEFWRILAPCGVLVFKCQDVIESGKQILTHCIVVDMALRIGFTALDLFVLGAKTRPIGHNHSKQYHARKFHSYFLVFQKPTARQLRLREATA